MYIARIDGSSCWRLALRVGMTVGLVSLALASCSSDGAESRQETSGLSARVLPADAQPTSTTDSPGGLVLDQNRIVLRYMPPGFKLLGSGDSFPGLNGESISAFTFVGAGKSFTVAVHRGQGVEDTFQLSVAKAAVTKRGDGVGMYQVENVAARSVDIGWVVTPRLVAWITSPNIEVPELQKIANGVEVRA